MDNNKTGGVNAAHSNNFTYWLLWQRIMFRAVLVLVGIFTLYRSFIFLMYRSGKGLGTIKTDIVKSFFTGARFDIIVALYLCLPLLIISLLLLFITNWRQKIYSIGLRFTRVYFTVIGILCIAFCIVDFYYYKFFQNHINEVFFDFISDDTKAVTQFLYKDYPLVSLSIGLVAAGIILFYTAKKWVTAGVAYQAHFTPGKKILLVLASALALIIGARGTLPLPKSSPLTLEQSVVSGNTFLNTVCLNPLFTFKEACFNLRGGYFIPGMNRVLEQNGFQNVEEAFTFYTNRKHTGITIDSLFTQVPASQALVQDKPNVVFIQMESMSSHLLEFHNSEKNNLLGQLQEELPGAYHFPHALSGYNGTIYSLEGLVINTPHAPVSQSVYHNLPFAGSCALPYFTAGYNTCFITGAKADWRNLQAFIPHQHFSIMEGMDIIEKKVPGTESNEWGAYDEFLFERVQQVLDSSKAPVFVYAMTTTNHPRYMLPKKYRPLPVQLSDELKKNKTKAEQELMYKNLQSFQYANHCLGVFLKKLRQSPEGKKTIVAITGDHNIQNLKNYADAELFQKRSVPIIFFVPDTYRPAFEVDTTRFASHKDIFPTLYALSLPGARHLALGNNLLQPQGTDTRFFALNDNNFACSNAGAILLKQKLLYKWADSTRRRLVPAAFGSSVQLDSLFRLAQAQNVLANFYMTQCVKKP
ncbi:MAG TPA: LTA synthase family protein [Ferruginibacter sp.]|nr:LTA synthase family protein [Ferruginibacter sp.]HMP22034.1 LTA synthase family protein [Ferruginibacter sp.]